MISIVIGLTILRIVIKMQHHWTLLGFVYSICIVAHLKSAILDEQAYFKYLLFTNINQSERHLNGHIKCKKHFKMELRNLCHMQRRHVCFNITYVFVGT